VAYQPLDTRSNPVGGDGAPPRIHHSGGLERGLPVERALEPDCPEEGKEVGREVPLVERCNEKEESKVLVETNATPLVNSPVSGRKMLKLRNM